MPTTKGLAPGVYVQDVKPLLRPYESASISNLAMISQATIHFNGATDLQSVQLTSFDDFCQKCGGGSLLVSRLMEEEIIWNWTKDSKPAPARPEIAGSFLERFLKELATAKAQIQKKYLLAGFSPMMPRLEGPDTSYKPPESKLPDDAPSRASELDAAKNEAGEKAQAAAGKAKGSPEGAEFNGAKNKLVSKLDRLKEILPANVIEKAKTAVKANNGNKEELIAAIKPVQDELTKKIANPTKVPPEWSEFDKAKQDLAAAEKAYLEAKTEEDKKAKREEIAPLATAFQEKLENFEAKLTKPLDRFVLRLSILDEQIQALRKGTDVPGTTGSMIVSSLNGFEGSLKGIDTDSAAKSEFLQQLGPIAVTAWSVWGFFQNGGKILTLFDVPWDSVETFAGTELSRLADPVVDAGLVCAPGQSNPAVWNSLRDYGGRRDLVDAEGESFCFAVLDGPDVPADKIKSPDTGEGFDAHSAACYYPWLVVKETKAGTNIVIPPAAFVAGIIAGTDSSLGAHHAPAGDDKVIKGSLGLTRFVNDTHAGTLNDRGVNCLRRFPNRRPVVFGSRTLSTDINYRYIPVARLLLQIRKTIKSQTRWAVHKPNTESLRKAIHRNLYTYLEGLRRAEALEGNSPEEAFRVVCDETNNPDSSRRQGILNVRVEVAPVRPAEFIMVEVTQKVQAS
jgi:hypothetical protein